MRIAVDAMGGDHAPREIIRGVAVGIEKIPDIEIVLYGLEDRIEAELAQAKLDDARVTIEHCSQIIEMSESPVEALRHKRDSSIARIAVAAARREVDAIISAGNTGAFAAACQLSRIGNLPGVARPGIAATLPTFHGPVVVCDVGANVTPKARHLYEYAHMSVCYAQTILGIKAPRVGMVSIGQEASKGNTLVREARSLIEQDERLNFVGNVEGRDIFASDCDVFVCDGFVGNVILKLTEGLAEGIFKTLRKEISEEGPNLIEQFEPVIERIWQKHDYTEYGGAPLLGVNTVVIICHGRSDHRAIANAIRVAAEQVRLDLNGAISDHLSKPAEGGA